MVSPHEIWTTLKKDLPLRDKIVDFLNSGDFLDSAQRVDEAAKQHPPYRPGMACIAKVPSSFLPFSATAHSAEPTHSRATTDGLDLEAASIGAGGRA